LAFPELKKVILATDNNLVMADNLEDGIALLLPEEAAPAQTPGTVKSGDSILSELEKIELEAAELQTSLDRLLESLESLKQLREALGGETP
jgi:uncharacterized membrane protein (UPF0182 family)